MRPANKLLALVRSELIGVESLGKETSPRWEGLNSDGEFSHEKLACNGSDGLICDFDWKVGYFCVCWVACRLGS
jgi:hypothetical protein